MAWAMNIALALFSQQFADGAGDEFTDRPARPSLIEDFRRASSRAAFHRRRSSSLEIGRSDSDRSLVHLVVRH